MVKDEFGDVGGDLAEPADAAATPSSMLSSSLIKSRFASLVLVSAMYPGMMQAFTSAIHVVWCHFGRMYSPKSVLHAFLIFSSSTSGSWRHCEKATTSCLVSFDAHFDWQARVTAVSNASKHNG